MSARQPGTAPVKPEYILHRTHQTLHEVDDDLAESNLDGPSPTDGEPPLKKARTSGSHKHDSEKKRAKGSNKGRKFARVKEELEICWKVALGKPCTDGESCRFTHDIPTYLSTKDRDIFFPSPSSAISTPPFIASHSDFVPPLLTPSVNANTTCAAFLEYGQCKHGFKCRFLGAHIQKSDDGQSQLHTDGLRLVSAEPDVVGKKIAENTERNFVDHGLMKALRTKKYLTPISNEYICGLETIAEPKAQTEPPALNGSADFNAVDPGLEVLATEDTPTTSSGIDVPLRLAEKKTLRWEGMTYLAPLTTVGNLPFRRLCTSLGADITCSEMSLATSLLSGSKEEWSLVRRHPSERVFGVQLAGSKPATLVPTAEILAAQFGAGGIDFVDLNCGCPIDLVFRSGGGSALLDSVGKLGKILTGMNRALGEIPLTVKLRTGVKEGKNTAHKLIPRLRGWGVGAVTVHGRTRQQRYTKLADWGYIKDCVETLRNSTEDDDLPSIPIFGGGDVYSSETYWSSIEQTGVDGIMIGRGALIKPWIFTEVKERREWDISSRERLELIRKYAEYGLTHWGTDTMGVNTTRRFLCEALSFQYRYVPIGLLEVLPGHINDRAPPFRGRDELETLLASPNSQDWVRISEMFLGPTPESWSFTPKHKSNAYGSEEANG